MIDFEDAYQIANTYITNLGNSCALPLEITEIITEDFGWIFIYNSSIYVKSGNFRDKLLGNSPFLVEKKTGEVVLCGTHQSVESFITNYKS
ncbi:hypothetical protein L1281_002568 [Neisseria sp. HSC-16F19]|nr:YrhB domain-containing protein [Neisseria sp. HSC-16F19]MCP2041950.1 hypothetical protein [Neisseria sp. HSC-16F19]